MKVVINTCYGKFGLSEKAKKLYCERTGIEKIYNWEIERNDPVLVQVVEELGEEADGDYGQLKVVDIPEDVQWDINDYDGKEWVAEVHRTWS
jgi:hypothetical protein